MAKVYQVLLLTALSLIAVDAFFLNSIGGLYSDVTSRPWESLSLVALKSYLFGTLTGRLASNRYNRPQHRYPVQAYPQYQYVQQKRGRRDIVAEDEDDIQVENVFNERAFLDAIAKLDVDKCITRLICEVEAGASVTHTGQFEKMIDEVFGDQEPETVNGDQQIFASVYHYAAHLGKNVQSSAECHQHFPKCKSPAVEYRKLAERIFFDSTDDDNQ